MLNNNCYSYRSPQIWRCEFDWLTLVKRFLCHQMFTNIIWLNKQNGCRRWQFCVASKRYRFTKFCEKTVWWLLSLKPDIIVSILVERQNVELARSAVQEDLHCENHRYLRVSVETFSTKTIYCHFEYNNLCSATN